MLATEVTPEKLVLVVEDDPPTRAAMEELLAQAGYTVLAAGDGEAALQLARAHRPDLVLIDLMLPRKSGWSVLEELRQDRRTSAIPTIVVSAFAALFLGGAPCQPDGYLEKPFDVSDLLAAVDDVLLSGARSARLRPAGAGR